MYIPCYIRHVFLTYTVLLCAIVNRNCNMDVSLYYKIFLLLMKNYCLIDILRITEWWYSVVQDSVMLYTGSFEMRINLPFSYDGVGSDIHFVFIQWLLRAHEWLCWRTQLCCANWTYAAYYFRVSSLCKCLISAYFKLSNSIPFLN